MSTDPHFAAMKEGRFDPERYILENNVHTHTYFPKTADIFYISDEGKLHRVFNELAAYSNGVFLNTRTARGAWIGAALCVVWPEWESVWTDWSDPAAPYGTTPELLTLRQVNDFLERFPNHWVVYGSG